MTRRVSIKSIGIHLPPERRGNDWWPSHIIDAWRERREKNPFKRDDGEQAETRGMQLALDAMNALRDDPFMGVRERRVRADGVKPSHMELEASRDAIARAGISPADIGAVMSSSHGPDTLLISNASLLHRELGIPAACITTGIDSVCNALAFQLLFAEQLIVTGRIRYALLVQSSTVRSVFPIEHPMLPLLGEAATAVIVGPAEDGSGLLSSYFETDGTQYDFVLIGNPDGPWYEKAPTVYGNGKLARRGSMMLADQISGVLKQAMTIAQVGPRDLSFIATHQGQGWIRPCVQELIDAPQARFHDTFAWTGTVGGSNIPLCLGLAERNGQLNRGDVVGLGMGGVGVTLAGMVLRW